jgi:hypothetical protein
VDIEISAQSRQYVKVPVTAKLAGAVVNPTSDVVQMAFALMGGAAPGTWSSAAWETDSSTSPATYLARIMVGPGGTVALTAGIYDVWVKVTDSPEIPVLRSATRLKVI